MEAGRPKRGQEGKTLKKHDLGRYLSTPENLRRALGTPCFLTPLLWFCYIYPFYDARIIELLFARKTEN